MFGRSKSLVGLDIGSSAVKAIELKPAGKGYKVTAIGTEPIPPDSIVDGAIIDGTAVVDAIRRVFESRNIKTKQVATAVSGHSVIVKKISLPTMTREELERVDPLGGRAVHPVRHQRSEPRLPDPVGGDDGGRGRWTCCSSPPRRT